MGKIIAGIIAGLIIGGLVGAAFTWQYAGGRIEQGDRELAAYSNLVRGISDLHRELADQAGRVKNSVEIGRASCRERV